MVRDIKERLDGGDRMVVSPDVGGVVRARALAKRIDAPLAIVDKRRERPGESEVMNIIGDVAGRSCILVDDIVDSGGTLVNAAEALLANGAKDVYAYITHGVLSGGAVSRIANSKLKELVITDSIQPTEAVKVARNIRVISIAPLIGEAIGRTATESSVSSLFDGRPAPAGEAAHRPLPRGEGRGGDPGGTPAGAPDPALRSPPRTFGRDPLRAAGRGEAGASSGAVSGTPPLA